MLSDRYSQIDNSEDEEDFTQRLAEAGERLKRKSTMVSTLGFKRPPTNYEKEDYKTKFKANDTVYEVPEINIDSLENTTPVPDKNQAKFQKLLKKANKRKISANRTRGVAF